MKKDYKQFVEEALRLPSESKSDPLVLDLFAGCGGLALGFEAAGFRTVGYEMNPGAAESYRHNLAGDCITNRIDSGFSYDSPATVVIGGPPCQPFSVGGLQNGAKDDRDGFPAFLWAVESLAPELVIFENVRGMLYRGRKYLDGILGSIGKLGYLVDVALLKAVHFGVPQRRERLFVVGHRGRWSWPSPTVRSPFTAGEALGRMALVVRKDTRFLTESMDEYVARYEAKSQCIRPRDLHLDQPSRTVTCRNLHGATGDMLRIRLPDGRRKRLSVREGARLQSFPDWFQFSGKEGSQFNQVGNAVPPLLAKAVAVKAMEYLKSDYRVDESEIVKTSPLAQQSLAF